MATGTRTVLATLVVAAGVAACGSVSRAAVHAETIRNAEFPKRIAVFPIHNLSRQAAPLVEIRKSVETAIIERGLSPMPPGELESILDRLRVRYVGGVSAALGRSLRTEGAVDGVLITALDLFEAADPPRVSLHARLVSIEGEDVRVLWAGSADRSGDQEPGLFERHRIRDMGAVVARAIESLADDLAAFAWNPAPDRSRVRLPEHERRFLPRSLFVSPRAPRIGDDALRVAVLPFVDDSLRQYAGEIVSLHVVRELVEMGRFTVVEPGQVRQTLLDTRTVQEGGISFAQADVLRSLLDVDMVITGDVAEYGEAGEGVPPTLDFTAHGVDAQRRQVAWASRSHSAGRDGVFFFDKGELRTTHGLARETVRSLVAELVLQSRRTERISGKDDE